MKQFYELAAINKHVLPGAPLQETEIFFTGRDCFDRLSHHDRASVYLNVQSEIREQAKKAFLVSLTSSR